MNAEVLKSRFAKEQKRQASMRHVYAYRFAETSELSDNFLVLPYNSFEVNKAWLERCLCEMDKDLVARMKGYEIVRLGVWYKDKNRFDFLKQPEFLFRVCDVLERKEKTK